MVHNIDNYSDFIIYHRIQPEGQLMLHYLCFPAVYMVLSGNVRLFLNGKSLCLKASELLLINSYEGFSFQFENAVVCQFIFNLPLFEQKLGLSVPDYFQCSSQHCPDSKEIARLRALLAEYVRLLASPEHRIDRQLLSFEILRFMNTHFAVPKHSRPTSKETPGLKHIRQAMRFMQQHYKEALTLQDIAGSCYVSVPYLSKLFKENFRCSIFNALTQIRLANAWPSVVYGQETLEAIALENGFANARAFTKAFFDQYGDYPSHCRQKGKAVDIVSNDIEEDLLRLFLPYSGSLGKDGAAGNLSPAPCHLNIQAAAPGVPLNNHLFNLLFIGDARHISVTELKSLLPALQRTFHYTYAYISGILSRLLLQSIETTYPGNTLLSFIHVDSVLELLLDAGLTPCIDLFCINHGLSSLPEYTRALLLHFKEKYGPEALRQWLFIPGGCPLNFFGPEMNVPSIDFEYFSQIVSIIKDIDPKIQVGSPLLMPGCQKEVWLWLMDFSAFCTDRGCTPDFYSLIHYPITPAKAAREPFIFRQNETRSSMSQMLTQMEGLLSSGKLPKRPVFIIEWNTSISNKDFTNDSLYKAANLMETLLDNCDRAFCFGYSLAFDGLEMFPVSSRPVHGGKGLFCSNGVKKPAFWALLWLKAMGDTLVARRKGCFITRRGDSLQMYFYYPVPMALSMAADTQSNLRLVNMINSTPVDKDGQPLSAAAIDAFLGDSQEQERRFEIDLNGLPLKEYMVTHLKLTRQQCECFIQAYDGLVLCPSGSGNLTDYWNASVTPEISCRAYSEAEHTLTEPSLHLQCSLAPGEIAYIEVSPLPKK